MIIRQYSLRLLLSITTVCAGVSLIFSFAWRGQAWAIAISVFVLGLLAIVLVQGFTFWLVWLFSLVADRRRGRTAVVTAVGQASAGGMS